jgi:hypothetical protein
MLPPISLDSALEGEMKIRMLAAEKPTKLSKSEKAACNARQF